MAIEVFMPKMSDHMDAGVIIGWLVKEGEKVDQGQPILELETDKAAVELEAPESGILVGIRAGVEAGARVPVGETIAYIVKTQEEEVPRLPPLGDVTTASSQQDVDVLNDKQVSLSQTPADDGGEVRAAPAVRRLARELGVDLQQVRGSGPGGRILESDLMAFVESQKLTSQQPQPEINQESRHALSVSPVARRMAQEAGVDLANVKTGVKSGRITKEDVRAYVEANEIDTRAQTTESAEWLELTRAQLMTGQRMVESVHTAPQFALTISVDMTRALELRDTLLARIEAETGARPSVTAILVLIVAKALRIYPRANASFVDGKVRLHKQVNIGVAVGSEEGLIVPVIHNADQKNLSEITRELKLIQDKASRMRFGPNDLTGGTFTISNLGMFGVDHFHAIINPPESAILAVGRIIKTPVGMMDDSIALRPMMNLTLSVDHRSLDGMQGAKFLSLLKERLEQPYLNF